MKYIVIEFICGWGGGRGGERTWKVSQVQSFTSQLIGVDHFTTLETQIFAPSLDDAGQHADPRFQEQGLC